MSARFWWRRPKIEIAEVIRAHGGDAIVTDPNLPSGSDRIAAGAVACAIPPGASALSSICRAIFRPSMPCRSSAAWRAWSTRPSTFRPLRRASKPDRTDADNPNIVKAIAPLGEDREVAFARDFVRRLQPEQEPPYWHHIGVYAYQRERSSAL